MEPFNWNCPYCGHHSTITSEDFSHGYSLIRVKNKNYSAPALVHEAISCPNPECRELTLVAYLNRYGFEAGQSSGKVSIQERYLEWKLRPRSKAKPLPDYVPAPIANDYKEACLICEDSPKASATLARRCLQGMIRDFWSLPKKQIGRLSSELDAIRENVDPDTWNAIDTIRSMGNIGAHMEKDINIIVEVDVGEAELLIELIEMLISDWYIQREKRRERTQKAIDLATQKQSDRVTAGKARPFSGDTETD